MHPYIPYLLEDIKGAHRTIDPPTGEEFPSSIIEELEEIDRWVTSEEPEHTFGYYCGLKSVDFPPAEQLSDEDLLCVYNAFRDLLFSWNADISLPGAVPLALKYKCTVATLDERFTVMNTGFITFDHCDGYCPDCALKEYCPCLEIWNKPDN